MTYEWYKGQEVIYIRDILSERETKTIEEVTDKGLARIGNEYFKPDGTIFGIEGNLFAWICPNTTEAIEQRNHEVNRKNLMYELRNADLTDEQVTKIRAILKDSRSLTWTFKKGAD